MSRMSEAALFKKKKKPGLCPELASLMHALLMQMPTLSSALPLSQPGSEEVSSCAREEEREHRAKSWESSKNRSTSFEASWGRQEGRKTDRVGRNESKPHIVTE